MDIKKYDMCGEDLKSAFSPPEQNEGKESAKLHVEIRILNNFKKGERSLRLLELCESCHYKLIDFIENSNLVYTTLASEKEAIESPKTKWWQRTRKSGRK